MPSIPDRIHEGDEWRWKKWEYGPTERDDDGGAKYCSVCGACPPLALEKALDAGVEVQWNGFLDDHNLPSLAVFTYDFGGVTAEGASEDFDDPLYFLHCTLFDLSHLWELDCADRKRILDKIVVASEADPVFVYEQFEVDREEIPPTPEPPVEPPAEPPVEQPPSEPPAEPPAESPAQPQARVKSIHEAIRTVESVDTDYQPSLPDLSVPANDGIGVIDTVETSLQVPFTDPGVDPNYVPVYDVSVSVGQLNQALLDSNPDGTRFALEPGVHRLTSALSPKTNQQLLGHPGAIINGSKVLTGWVVDGSHWYVANQTQRLPETDAPGYTICSASNPLCNKAEDVFYDDQPLEQVDSLASLATGKFFFDYTNSRIYVADDPNGHVVETTIATQAINGGGSGVVIRNLVVEKFGNRAQIGAISDGKQPGWTIQNCEARYNHGGGIQISGSNAVLRNSKINYNGQIGVVTGYDAVNNPLNQLVENNEIAYNNTEGYNAGWEAGGTKFSLTTDIIIKDNHVHDNNGPGIWCDIDVDGATISNNNVHHNVDKGIVYEISHDAIIENNIVWENGYGYDVWVWGAGILVQNSYGCTVRNNLVAWNADGIGIIQQDRGNYTEVTNTHIHDNVVAGKNTLLGWVSDVANKTLFDPASNNRGNTNRYYNAGGASWEWNGWYGDITSFNGTPGEESGTMMPKNELDTMLIDAGIPTSPSR